MEHEQFEFSQVDSLEGLERKFIEPILGYQAAGSATTKNMPLDVILRYIRSSRLFNRFTHLSKATGRIKKIVSKKASNIKLVKNAQVNHLKEKCCRDLQASSKLQMICQINQGYNSQFYDSMKKVEDSIQDIQQRLKYRCGKIRKKTFSSTSSNLPVENSTPVHKELLNSKNQNLEKSRYLTMATNKSKTAANVNDLISSQLAYKQIQADDNILIFSRQVILEQKDGPRNCFRFDFLEDLEH